MFTFESLLDPAHLKWAKRNMLPEDSKFKMLLTANHWLIEESSDPDAIRKELTTLLAIRAQTSTWTLNLRTKQEQYKNIKDEVPIELITDSDYYVLARNFDDTYRFSDDNRAYDRGFEQEKYLNMIIAARPHLKDTWGTKPHDVAALATSADLMACLRLYHQDLNLDGTSYSSAMLADAMDLSSKAEFQVWHRINAKMSQWHGVTKNWACNNDYGRALLYTPHTPRGVFGVSSPTDWTDTLKGIGVALDDLFENPRNRRMIERMKHAGFYEQESLTINVNSTAKNERLVTLCYGNIMFYHKFKFFVNGN